MPFTHFRTTVSCSMAALAISASASCTGSLDSPLGPSTRGEPGQAPDGTDDGEQGALGLGRTGLRRLNNTEYDNTVRDLLGTKLTPAKTFLAEEASGFDNVASALGMTGGQFESYFNAAETLAADVFADSTRRMRVMPCTGTDPDGGSCLDQVLDEFGTLAFRRPVEAAERADLHAGFSRARQAGESPDGAMQHVLTLILTSPQFLYRPESPAADAATNSYELASRLSYFLWSTLPDAALFEAARAGKLATDEQLTQQVTRMLADKKAQALVDNFAGQWLGLRDLATHKVVPEKYPSFDEELRADLSAEARAYFSEFLFEGRPMTEFLSAPVHYVNTRLASYYGIPNVTSDQLVRVETDIDERMGFIGLGSFLTVSSFAHRTSPTLRAKWIIEELLCSPLPPPPPGVQADLEGDDKANAAAAIENVRERLELHRSDPSCASCHALMDPIGLGLESFDAIGQARDTYENGDAVDTRGVLPDGQKFDGPRELSAVLSDDPRFPRCVAQKMLTFALGRSVETSEQALIDRTRDAYLAQGATLRALIDTIVLSDAFRGRAAEESNP